MSLQNKAECFSEYDKLEQVVLCEPQYMTILDTINETQKHYKKEGIDIERAMKQHRHFVSALKEQGVDVVLLPPLEKYPEQVFTRDIGFTLGEKVYVAEMAADIRQGEENVLKQWLEQQQIPFYNLTGDRIEGGDVLIDGKTIYVGVSNRTFEEAIEHLRSLLPEYEIISIPFTDTYLHLDCVFNIISPEEALIFPGEIHGEKVKMLESRYDLIRVSEDEQFTLGTNVLSIGNKKIFSLPVNKNVNKELRARGYEVIEVDITEIIKSGGAFRCCTMPVRRGKGS
ncbi:dimethylarginine dimethylaminohydrolase family protein [Bacillus sp. ISL-47]|uniref:dimethylarginine dimethylaminohydrolase family protein n=1 Tax=Bacillus sp. ISL-47 TaxID=2819130 RepID=UPI001BECD933|nr:dimethylarginine dimethylaminohydrolase family protein [Bacillus sp. ISL-47]MBT2690309.1 dimethylarginine dimethylaminohydrolase family protein [Bacillus sp. ISL-47]MBT2706541.1 dimethylarginine dimethylaminohydrolase family protein [Pseudomonas sp. ISL-84]